MNPKFKPDKALFRYLKTEYAKEVHGYSTFNFTDVTLDRLLKTAYAITAFLKTKHGAEAIFSMAGVEEVEPHPGFDYQHEKTGRIVQERENLRIFRRITKERVELSRSALDTVRRVLYAESWSCPEEEFITKVFRHYRNWFGTGMGQSWAFNNYKALDVIRNSNGVVYRYETDDNRIYWFDDRDIVPIARPEDHCINCDTSYPCCDNFSGMGVMCNRCYSEHFADAEVLKSCTRHECKAIGCHNYMTERQFYDIVENPHNMPIKWTACG